MRIESGFGKFEVGETIDIILEEIKYTKKNHRPYAIVHTDTKETAAQFNVNIKDSDATLQPGRYTLKCTGVNNVGFCYVKLTKKQHNSWDVHDESSFDELRDTVADELINTIAEPPVDSTYLRLVEMKHAIELTRKFKEELNVFDTSINEDIEDILDVLYHRYGMIANEEE